MLEAFRDGAGRMLRAPLLAAGLWLATLAVTLPLAVAVGGDVERHLGSSLEADPAAEGINYNWMQEFSGQATGLSASLSPSVIGFAAVLDNLSAVVDRTLRPALVVAAIAGYLLALTFLAPGIIDRLARDRATRAYGFFAISGGFFFRFIRLGLLGACAYGLLLGPVHSWVFDRLYPWTTAEMTVERDAFIVRLLLYGALLLPLAALNLVLDYAKVRAVVEDRTSMIGAIVASVVFVRRHPGSTMGLYVLNVFVWLTVLGTYALVAPGVGGAGTAMWGAFAIGQAYVLARTWVKLLFWASATALFQRHLAHAGYVARALPSWPDPPAAL